MLAGERVSVGCDPLSLPLALLPPLQEARPPTRPPMIRALATNERTTFESAWEGMVERIMATPGVLGLGGRAASVPDPQQHCPAYLTYRSNANSLGVRCWRIRSCTPSQKWYRASPVWGVYMNYAIPCPLDLLTTAAINFLQVRKFVCSTATVVASSWSMVLAR